MGGIFSHSKKSLSMCCVYCPPSKVDFYDYFTSECEKGCMNQKNLHFGDFNPDLLHSTLPQSHCLQDFVSAFHVEDICSGPTRVT